ncbi:MAG: PspA/IM30 family protein [Methylococcales bacterium]|nr:PspA/IM30 family protein [Methylococcales bacterium]
MNVWSKLMTALRGGANEMGEIFADAQALRILDQEVREASDELNISRNSLADMMAREKVSEQKCSSLNTEIAEYEDYAIKALEKQDEPLALELAEKIATLETQLNTEQNARNEYKQSIDSLRNSIKQADSNIKQIKFQIDTIKATENVQRAQAAVAQRHSGSTSKLTTAMESLERIKEKQQLKTAKFNASEELAEDVSNDSLKNRLEDAGIMPGRLNGETVLARLKNKATQA